MTRNDPRFVSEHEAATIFMRPLEAAYQLRVSRSRLYGMLNDGTLPGVRLAGRTWRIPRAAIEKLAREAMGEK